MGNTSISIPVSSRLRMSRSKNVATRAGYLLVKTATLTPPPPCSPRQPLLAQPQLQREEHEDPLEQAATAERPPAGAVLGPAEGCEPLPHQGSAQRAARAGIRSEQQLVEDPVKVARDHDVERDAESLFGAAGDLRRQPAARQRTEHALAGPAVGLQGVGQREAQRYDVLVEQRDPHLDARPHAHHVDL